MKVVSELRQDIVSGDWVVIATGRAKRPHDFLTQRRVPFRQSKIACPFEVLHSDALFTCAADGKEKDEKWWVQVIPNKYPAFGNGVCSLFHRAGPYHWTEGVGFHEIVITRDHERPIALMSGEEVTLLLQAYQERYRAIQEDDCVEYISIFHNHGREAGATIAHPHSQIIALPVVPPDIARSLQGSWRYFKEKKRCVHCAMIRYEMKVRERVIYENEEFLACAPFASKTAFEVRVFPKRHSPRFEEASVLQLKSCAEAFRAAHAKLFRGLKNPDYNFFLHTAPVGGNTGTFQHYHWHFEILPKTAVWAGFEIGTGIEISVITPERAAEFLRKIKI